MMLLEPLPVGDEFVSDKVRYIFDQVLVSFSHGSLRVLVPKQAKVNAI